MQRGALVRRFKRFLAEIELENGERITAHCPNPGRMTGCSDPGSTVYVSLAANPRRALRYTWEIVKTPATWVGINTFRTNAIIARALQRRCIPELADYQTFRREVRIDKGCRLDFMLTRGGHSLFVEAKNVTLVTSQVALFPDAVTVRGRKHLQELSKLVKLGHRALIFFLVQREDATSFAPADHIDPAYGEALRTAVRSGVEVLVYDTSVNPKHIRIRRRIAWGAGLWSSAEAAGA